MGKTGQFAEKQTAVQSTGFEKFKTVMSKINSVINLIGVWLFRLRKFIMAAPVIYAAIRLASYNGQHLPEQVGLDLQSTGEFAMTVSRQLAVMGPLGLTAACLLLMFCSRKAMYPWAISIFTLALPVLLLVDGADVTSDADKLAKASVTAEVLGATKGPKITILKYKNKTGYRKRQGHRQKYTQVKVTDISA